MVDINLHHRGTVPAQHPWPEDIECLQGGGDGVVFGGKEGSYRTAFVEASDKRFGFIRGEGATVALAEDAAWAKAQKAMGCPGHEYEARGYTNGCGFCKHCGRFATKVFTLAEVGSLCAACGEPTDYTHVIRPDNGEQIKLCRVHRICTDTWMCSCARCRARTAAEEAAEGPLDLFTEQGQAAIGAAVAAFEGIKASVPRRESR